MGQPTEEQKRWLDIIKNESHKIGHLAGFKKLTPLHHEWIKKMLMNKGTYVLKAHRGGYKCLNPNTKVMMADYSSKEIKDIQIGEYVMGWDGTPRKVLDVHCGRSPMYRVTLNKNGEYYECNNNHILSLYSKTPLIDLEKYFFKHYKCGYIYNIEIEDFLRFTNKKTLKHFKVNKTFNEIISFDFEITSCGIGDFVGIVIDGDGMFLLDNFLVVHNTTCIEEFIALKMILCPDQTMIFVRKTDDDVKEVVEKVKSLLQTPVFKEMVRVFYNTQLEFKKATAFEIDTNLHKELGGGSQLLAIGLKGSITGKHADGIIVDDICFVGGTQIATPFGDRNIEDLKVGDLVLTSNRYEKIVRTTNRKADVICNVGLCGTPNHPVFSSEINDYKPLKDITESELVRYNSKTYNTPQLKGIQTVYNIEVEKTHNYYANGILVHNCNTKDRESRAERELTKRIWFELNSNIKNPSGWVVSTGTTWHPDDVFSVMPPAEIYTCYDTGLLTDEQIQEIKDNMPPALFAANYELRFVASDDCMFTTPNMVDEKDYYDEENKVTYLDLLKNGICFLDAGYGGGDYTAFFTMNKIKNTSDYIAYGRCWRKHVNDCIPEIENLIKKYHLGTLRLENNGDKGYLAREFKYRGIRVATYHERMNKYTKISTYLYRLWKNIKWTKQTDEIFIGQILDYTETAEHDDCADIAANGCRFYIGSGKVVAMSGINI